MTDISAYVSWVGFPVDSGDFGSADAPSLACGMESSHLPVHEFAIPNPLDSHYFVVPCFEIVELLVDEFPGSVNIWR